MGTINFRTRNDHVEAKLIDYGVICTLKQTWVCFGTHTCPHAHVSVHFVRLLVCVCVWCVCVCVCVRVVCLCGLMSPQPSYPTHVFQTNLT
jgi:hypothetical protein